MFLGDPVSVARFDEQKFPVFERLTERQLSLFWRPEEVDISQDRADYERLSDAGKHIFTSNIKYQTALDSVQGRSPTMALLPIVSLPELENWIETWSFSETIHSRSYTYILRTIFDNPSKILDDITVNPQILKRAESISASYDKLISIGQDYHRGYREKTDVKKSLLECMYVINALEGVRFYVSFACSFAYAERGQMEGNAKLIRLIADDEAVHLNGTQNIINYWRTGQDDPDMEKYVLKSGDLIRDIYSEVANQEKEWAQYLFSSGSMIGLNESILADYVDFITDQRMKAVGTAPLFGDKGKNPIPWINNWLTSNNVQVAPQETELTSYLTSQVNMNVPANAFNHYSKRLKR
jgi:ribonucleoside-diphosphate reductase beta chain